MNEREIESHVERVRLRGYTVLEDHCSRDVVARIAAAFEPVYAANLDAIRTNPNRGPMRHYIQLPLAPPFYASEIIGDPAIIGIVRGLLGEDAELVQYATDTPARGSVTQEWHSDLGALFPEEPDACPPPPIIAVNFPFVDVRPENGPFEIVEATHRIPKAEALAKIDRGEMSPRPLLLNVGDVLIRDPRCIHRGTPNRTDSPRPVAVLTYERAWCCMLSRRFHNPVSRALYETLSEAEQQILQRVVET